MFFAVIKREDGKDVGINQSGTRETERGNFELMDEQTAEALAKEHDALAVSEHRLFPQDFESEV